MSEKISLDSSASIYKQNISIYQVPLVTLKKEANIQTL